MKTEYQQVSSPTAFAKKGKQSKCKATTDVVKEWKGGMYEAPDIGVIPPSDRTIMKNNYCKDPKKRKDQGDVAAELRTESYVMGTYLRSK